MAAGMTSRERTLTALRLGQPDRVPLGAFATGIAAKTAGLTGREYATDGKKMALGQRTLHDQFGFDILFPFSHVGMISEAWGCKIRYPDADVAPMIDEYVVKDPRQWAELEVLDPKTAPGMRVVIEAAGTLKEWYGDEVFVLGVMFSPMTTATHVRSLGNTMVDIKRNPELLHTGLKVITESLVREARALQEAGADGIFYAITRATGEVMTLKQYREVAVGYDLEVLRSINVPVISHVCGRDPFLDLIAELPNMTALNWWDRGTQYSLADVKAKHGSRLCLAAGLDQTRTMVIGTPEDVEREAKDAIKQAAAGGGFILFSGCDLPIRVPGENMAALLRTVETYGRYPLTG